MDQEQPAAGDAANRGHRNEAVEAANDFVMEAAAGTTAVSISRSEDRTGATTASVAAATRGVCGSSDDEDGPARDMREFDHYIKMQLQQLGGGSEVAPARASRDQRLTRVSSSIPLLPRRRAAAAAGSAMAPARASLDRRLITRLQQQLPSPSSTEGGGSEVAPARESLDLELRL